LAKLAPALYRNTSINIHDLKGNRLGDIRDDGFVQNALEQNTSLLHLDLYNTCNLSERAFLALAEYLSCYQDFARTQACLVSTLPVVLLLWSQQHLTKKLDALAAGYRKWNVWVSGTAFSL
jgi:hypothetical protein